MRLATSTPARGPRVTACLLAGTLLALGLNACSSSKDSASAPGPGAVFTITNAAAPDGNQVVAFDRAANGDLTRKGAFPTGGDGVGAGGLFGIAGTSNPLVLDANHRYLYAVNAGSDTVTAFAVAADNTLTVIDTQSSVGSEGSTRPISLAINGSLLYVLNAGVPATATSPAIAGSITGFRLASDGSFAALAGSTEPLTGSATGPSQISFSPGGSTLVVTDKPSQTIITYAVDANGVAGPPVPTTAEGVTPFGFEFARNGTLVVSEANVVPGSGPTPDGGTVSSYSLNSAGGVTAISSQVAAGGTATCWIRATVDGRYAYATNTASGTIAGFQVAADGSLSRLADGNQGLTTVTTETGPKVLDLVLVGNDFLYATDETSGNIFAYSIQANGALTTIAANGSGLPDSFVGVAAF